MIEGVVFAFLALTGIPYYYQTDPGAGSYCYLCYWILLAQLGLQTAEGIGIVVSDIATEDKRTPMVAYTEVCKPEGNCTMSDAYTCDVLGGVMSSPPTGSESWTHDHGHHAGLQIVSVEPVDLVLGKFTSDLGRVGVALFTFLYVDFLDTSGTLLASVQDLGFVDEKGDFPNSRAAFTCDALATSFRSIFGLSPTTSYVESSSGVKV